MGQGIITAIGDSLIKARFLSGSAIGEAVHVGCGHLVGEIVALDGDCATIRMCEDTYGLVVGDPVYGDDEPLVVRIMPELLGSMVDGLLRPLGILPVVDDSNGSLPAPEDWPVRQVRQPNEPIASSELLRTGWRGADTLFPMMRGGTAALIGRDGRDVSAVLRHIAMHADSDVVIYVGCGARGADMLGARDAFEQHIDPRTEQPVMRRTLLIANTADAPAASRDIAVLSGMAAAEYYRDAGLHVLLLIDSVGAWADGLRARACERDGSYPAETSRRIAELYARAGSVRGSGRNTEDGSISLIGALTLPIGDEPEPAYTAVMRCARVQWWLRDGRGWPHSLPVIDVMDSASSHVLQDDEWISLRDALIKRRRDAEPLLLIARFSGEEALDGADRFELGFARWIDRWLQDNDLGGGPDAPYWPVRMLSDCAQMGLRALEAGANTDDLLALPVLEWLQRASLFDESDSHVYAQIRSELIEAIDALTKGEEPL